MSQLVKASQRDQDGEFRANAVVLIGTLAPVLVWMRDNKCFQLDIDVIRRATELPWLLSLPAAPSSRGSRSSHCPPHRTA